MREINLSLSRSKSEAWEFRLFCKINMEGKMTNSEVIQIANWKVQVSSHAEVFPKQASNKLLKIVERWEKVFPKEKTWVQKEYGVPSLVIRADCVVSESGELGLYETEDRPAAIGITSLINDDFKKILQEFCAKKWPEFKVVKSASRTDNDDYLWRNKLNGTSNENTLVLVRSDPKEKEFNAFQSRSVSTIKTEGCKKYGETFGLWKKVSCDNIDSLPWNENFVLKPLQGTNSKDITIFFAKRNRKIRGGSTKSRVIKTLQENKKMYLQSFISPMQCPVLKNHLMIYRVFLGYDPAYGKFIGMGGCWNARENYNIHGTAETVWGPVILES